MVLGCTFSLMAHIWAREEGQHSSPLTRLGVWGQVYQTLVSPRCQKPRYDPWVGEIPLEKETIHSSVLAWRIPWAEEPGGLQSVGPHRVGHDGALVSSRG